MMASSEFYFAAAGGTTCTCFNNFCVQNDKKNPSLKSFEVSDSGKYNTGQLVNGQLRLIVSITTFCHQTKWHPTFLHHRVKTDILAPDFSAPDKLKMDKEFKDRNNIND